MTYVIMFYIWAGKHQYTSMRIYMVHSSLRIIFCNDAVSYTHLDVYKRQSQVSIKGDHNKGDSIIFPFSQKSGSLIF